MKMTDEQIERMAKGELPPEVIMCAHATQSQVLPPQYHGDTSGFAIQLMGHFNLSDATSPGRELRPNETVPDESSTSVVVFLDKESVIGLIETLQEALHNMLGMDLLSGLHFYQNAEDPRS